jgi:hypothetical protein
MRATATRDDTGSSPVLLFNAWRERSRTGAGKSRKPRPDPKVPRRAMSSNIEGLPSLDLRDQGLGPGPGLKHGISKASGLWRRFGGIASTRLEEEPG